MNYNASYHAQPFPTWKEQMFIYEQIYHVNEFRKDIPTMNVLLDYIYQQMGRFFNLLSLNFRVRPFHPKM